MNHNSYPGSKNSNWKGSDKNISERAKHYRIEAKKGPASKYMCAKCHKERAHDWAEMPDGSYRPYCRSCHNTLDSKIKNIQDHDKRYR